MRRRTFVAAMLAGPIISNLAGIGKAADIEVPGRITFVREGGIWFWENGETTRLLKQDSVADSRWSPDGERILFVQNGNSYSDLAILNVQTSLSTLLTDNQSRSELGTELYTAESVWALDPAWSASGRIAFVSDAAGAGSPLLTLWLMDGPEGEPYQAPLLAYEDENIDSVSLSGDGTVAAYVLRERPGNGALDVSVWLRDLGTGETFLAAQSGGEAFDPAVSPDGRHIAVAIREKGGKTDVWMVDRASLERKRVTRDAEALAPTWSSDGAWLAFLKMEDYQFEVWVAPVSKGRPGTPFKLFAANGLDAPSGLSWWVAPEPAEA